MQNSKLKFKINSPYFLVVIFSISFLAIPLVSQSATLYFQPQAQTVYQGDSFIIEIRINTEGEEINVLEASLTFPPDLSEIVDFNKGNSILTLWPKEPQTQRGEINFLGGTSEGFNGDGLITKIIFLGKEIGQAKINFKEDSKVLLNDGMGTPAKVSLSEGNYEIIKKREGLPVISSQSHPDQNKWYKSNTLSIYWEPSQGVQYNYLLNKDFLTEPEEISNQLIGDLEYKNLEDGIYYFILKQKLPGEDWSAKISFRAMIDKAPPELFQPKIGKDPSLFEGKYFLGFLTTDKSSGIDYYEIKEGKNNFEREVSPYLLLDQKLQSKILVKAVDRAGNEQIAEITPQPKPFPYWIIILIFGGAGIVFWLIRKLKFKYQKTK